MIRTITTHLPEKVLTNRELAEQDAAWTPDEIFKKTGIHSRHVMTRSEKASDLACAAAQKLLRSCGAEGHEVDFLVFCTQSPDYLLPTTACIIQDKLGLSTNCGAFDMNLGCSGYLYGLGVIHGLLESGLATTALLLTADAYSRYAGEGDLTTRTIFGDAGSDSHQRRGAMTKVIRVSST